MVGMGPSNTNVFLKLVEDARLIGRVVGEGNMPKKTIYLIDVEGNHGAGKAYGLNAHPSNIFEITARTFEDGFEHWLTHNENIWRPLVDRHREGQLKTWFKVNQRALDEGRYGDIRMPRFIYGYFKRGQLLDAIADAPEFLDIRILEGRVKEADECNKQQTVCLKFNGEGDEVKLHRNGSLRHLGTRHRELTVDYAVIGIGSPDPRRYPKVEKHEHYFRASYMKQLGDDRYFAKDFIETVKERFAATGQKVKLGVLGTSASFLDMMNIVYNEAGLKNMVEITAISRRGMPWVRPYNLTPNRYEPVVSILKPSYHVTSVYQFITDILAEIAIGKSKKFGTTEIIKGCRLYRPLFEQLSLQEREAFFDDPRIRPLRRYIENIPRESRIAIERLPIEYLPAGVSDISPEGELLRVHAKHPETGEKSDRLFDLVVNCTGFDKLTNMGIFKKGIENGDFSPTDDGENISVDAQAAASARMLISGFATFGDASTEKAFIFVNKANVRSQQDANQCALQLFGDELRAHELTKFDRPQLQGLARAAEASRGKA